MTEDIMLDEATDVVQTTQRFTQEQQNAINLARDLAPGECLRVRSGAGTGKTTTLLGMAHALTPKRGVYLAFNRTVAEEAYPKFTDTTCTPKTFHGLCLAAVRGSMSGGPVRYDIRQDVIDAGLVAPYRRELPPGWNEFSTGLAAMRTLEAFCHSDATEISGVHARKAITDMIGDPDNLIARKARSQADRTLRALAPILVSVARRFWSGRLRDGRLSHDVYVKIVQLDPDMRGRAFHNLDYAMADEAQDLNPVQVSILRQSGISVIAVGDSAQSIHGWRGARDALNHLEGKTAWLSQSFRFGETIAALANRILRAGPDEMNGVRLKGVGGNQPVPENVPSHAVLARSNMGLIDEAEAMHTRGMSFHLDRGDELREQIRSALALKKNKRHDIKSADIRPFRSWDDLVEESTGNPTFERLVQIVEDGRAGAVIRTIDSASPMNRAKVCLMTAHRAKGLEFSAVKMAGDWTPLHELGDKLAHASRVSPHRLLQARQEYNILYVAVTRAINRVENIHELM